VVVVHCDGLCEPVNPGGVACYGFVAYKKDRKLFEDCGVICSGEGATNNVAEYSAVIKALERLSENGFSEEPVEVRTDSQLCVYQLNGRYAVRSPRVFPLYRRALRLAKNFRNLRFAWVPREKNREADALSRKAYFASKRRPADAGRLERAKALVSLVRRTGDGVYVVPSQSGAGEYTVDLVAGTCTCPDFAKRGARCKHILAAGMACARQGAVSWSK